MVPLVPKAATEVPEDEDPRRVALQLNRLVRSGGTVVLQVYDAVIAMGYKAKLPVPSQNGRGLYLPVCGCRLRSLVIFVDQAAALWRRSTGMPCRASACLSWPWGARTRPWVLSWSF